MKQLSVVIFIFLAISCSQELKESNIQQIWIKDSKYYLSSSIILAFNDSTCSSTLIRSDYHDIQKEINNLYWNINSDTLVFTDSTNTESKYFIPSLTKDSLVLEHVNERNLDSIEGFSPDSNYSPNRTTFYSISPSKSKFTKKRLDKILLHNSFKFKTTFHNDSCVFNFVTRTKSIDNFDGVHFQLGYWETQIINNEVLLIMKNRIFTSVLHILQIRNDSLIFENIYDGINKSFLIKNNFKSNNKIEESLLGQWSSFSESSDSTFSILPPPPPISSRGKRKYTIGVSYQFLSNNTYVFKKGYDYKQGFWKLSQSKKYILLDSLKDYKDIIRVNSKANNSFSLSLYTDIEAQTELIELSKID